MRLVAIMEMSRHEVVDVVGVRDGFMAARGTMRVLRSVAAARVRTRARSRICGRNLQPVFVDVTFVHEMEMAVV